MAAIDSLLGIVAMKKADGIVLETDAVPALLLGGGRTPLTMPPLGSGTLEIFLAELFSIEDRAALTASRTVESTYEAGEMGPLSVRARREGSRLVLTLSRGAPRPSAPRARGPNLPGRPPFEAGPPFRTSAETDPAAAAAALPPLESVGGAAPPSRPASAPPPASPRLPVPLPTGGWAAQPSSPHAESPPPPPLSLPGAAEPASPFPPPTAAWRPPPTSAPPGSESRRIALDGILEEALDRGASDVILSTGSPPRARIAGDLEELPHPAFTDEDLLAALGSAVTGVRRRMLDEIGSVDLPYEHLRTDGGRTRSRVNLFRRHGGLAAAIRPIATGAPTIESLRLPLALQRLTALSHGLVLLTGPTGAGKSTTLAALIEHVNAGRACHVITLEDPIERLFATRRSIIHQREVGTDVPSFAAGLRAALRENPDLIAVGELRDAETIALALSAAETGHLVLATLHSGSATTAVERMVDAFPEGAQKAGARQQLAGVLRAVVNQRLLPATRGGRVPAIELLTVNHAVAAQIRDGRTHLLGTQIELGAEEGMITMERALADLVRAGTVRREAALAALLDPAPLEKLLPPR